MTHQIIDKMGGQIKVQNEKFEVDNNQYFGANFTICFPLNQN